MLSVKRKADRERMVAEIRALGLETDVLNWPGQRHTAVTVSREGLAAHVNLFGNSRNGETLVCSWTSKRRLKPDFALQICGSVNEFHGCKATTVNDIYGVLAAIERGFAYAADGAAFA